MHVTESEWIGAWSLFYIIVPHRSRPSLLLMSDPDLRGPRRLRQGPEVCELRQAGDRRSVSHESGRHGERRHRPHSSRGQPIDGSLWGRAGRWDELRDFLLRSEKLKKKKLCECFIFLWRKNKQKWTKQHKSKNDVIQKGQFCVLCYTEVNIVLVRYTLTFVNAKTHTQYHPHTLILGWHVSLWQFGIVMTQDHFLHCILILYWTWIIITLYTFIYCILNIL